MCELMREQHSRRLCTDDESYNPLKLHWMFLDISKTRKYRDIGRLGHFVRQSDLSAENGLFRLKKPKSSFLTQSKKGFFDSTFFD